MTCGALGYIWTMLSHFTIVPSVVCEVFHRQMEIKTGVLEVLFNRLILQILAEESSVLMGAGAKLSSSL